MKEFISGHWSHTVDVQDFIQRNYTPYDGDESFLTPPTQRTRELWDEVKVLLEKERQAGGVLDVDASTISDIDAYAPGYIDKDKEVIVGLQTDAPLKRAIMPFGGIRMVKKSLEAYGRKMARRVESYRACPLHLPELDEFAAYALDSAALLSGRPSTFQHGDYSVANMVLDAAFRLGVIDFDRMDYGDPWEEFSRLPWSVACSPAFSRALLRAYFRGEPPDAFWPLLALYVAVNQISSLPWAIPRGGEQVEILRRQARQVRAWYDGPYGLSRPTWYRQDEADEANHIER